MKRIPPSHFVRCGVLLAALLGVACSRNEPDVAVDSIPPVTAEHRAREERIRDLYSGAEELWNRGEYGAGLDALLSIVVIDPHHPLPQLGVVQMQLRRGDLAGADSQLDSFADVSEPAGRYGRGIVRLFQGRPGEAEPLLRSALSGYATMKHPSGLAATWTALGIVESWTARYDEALAHYDKALQVSERLGDRKAAADLYGNMAAVRQQTGDEAAALADFRRALATQEELGDHDGRSASLYNIGLILYDRGEYDQAMDSLSQALAINRRLGDPISEGKSINGIGLILLEQGDPEGATAAFESALELARAHEDPQTEAEAITNLGLVDLRAGRVEAALARHLEALEIRRGLGDRAGEADSLFNAGVARERLGETGRALQDFEAALAITRSVGIPRQEARVLQSLGGLRARLGDRSEGIAALQRAARLYTDIGADRGEASVREELGRVLTAAADYPGARLQLDRALELWVQLDDRAGRISTLRSLGVLHRRLGTFDIAVEYFERSLELLEEADDSGARADLLDDLGNVRFDQGEYAEALRLQHRSLQIRRELGDRREAATNLNNLGAVYRALGDSTNAMTYTRESLEQMQELGERAGEARARDNLGGLLEDAGDYDGARAQFEATVRIREALQDRRGAAFSRHDLAGTLRLLGRPGEAEEQLEAAQRTFQVSGDRGGEALTLVALGDLARSEGRLASAMERYEEALGHAEDAGMREAEWRAEAGIAACMEAGKEWAQALKFYERAIDGMESIRGGLVTQELKSSSLAGKVDLYERVVWLLSNHGRTFLEVDPSARAFEVAERGRARSLIDLLAEAGSDLRGRVAPGLLAREARLLARMAQLEADLGRPLEEEERIGIRKALARAEQEMELLMVEIRQSAPAYAEIAYPRPATAEEIRTDLLRPGEVVLQYLVGEEGSWLWKLSREEIRWWELPGRRELETGVLRLLGALQSPAADPGGEPAHLAPARDLGGLLLPDGSLPPRTRLIIVPDGILHYLPFEALIPSAGDPRGADHYLIESHVISYAPSATTLRLLRDRPAPGGAESNLLAMGDPSTDNLPENWDIPPLPHAHEEIVRIGRLFPETRRALWLGPAAAESVVKSEDLTGFRFIHLAAHGWIHEDAPVQSGIFLGRAEDEPDDGLLRFNEIFHLRMDAELVVLSGCRTGLGDRVRGEGMVGLTRALMYSGARSVVVSLWDVNDRSTPELMETMYRGLVNGWEPATALRAAKLALLRSDNPAYRHPSRWAAFVLSGDPGVPARLAARSGGG